MGGNTKVYGAILFRFRERDFRQIQHVDGVSPAWPLSYTDFEPWYIWAEHLYHVHGQRGADPSEPPSAAPYRYPPLSHEPRIAQLKADFTTAGLHPFPLPVGLVYDESAPQFSRHATIEEADMPQVTESTVVGGPVGEVWALMRDFGAIGDWHPALPPRSRMAPRTASAASGSLRWPAVTGRP